MNLNQEEWMRLYFCFKDFEHGVEEGLVSIEDEEYKE